MHLFLLYSIEFWFRVLDTDEDGLLSLFELEYFYEEQYRRLIAQGYEPIPFPDTVCQVRTFTFDFLSNSIRFDSISLSTSIMRMSWTCTVRERRCSTW